MAIVDPNTELDTIAPRPTDEEGVVKRSVAAHAYFKERIEQQVLVDGAFDEHRLEILFEALKEGLAAVSIELEGGDDPRAIFETLNSRGVDLTPGDLTRNFIFQRAEGMGRQICLWSSISSTKSTGCRWIRHFGANRHQEDGKRATAWTGC